MDKEELEKAIIHANICIKKWSKEKTHLMNSDAIRSMVNGWLVRILSRQLPLMRRKSFTKNLSKSLFISIDKENLCIDAIKVYVELPFLDFKELNDMANATMYEYYSPTNLHEIKLETIQNITFN